MLAGDVVFVMRSVYTMPVPEMLTGKSYNSKFCNTDINQWIH